MNKTRHIRLVIISVLLILISYLPSPISPLPSVFAPLRGFAANKMFWVPCLTGGGSCLDSIDGRDCSPTITTNCLTDGDGAIVIRDNSGTYEAYFFRLEDTAGAVESSPSVIIPDTNPGNKSWKLAKVFGSGLEISGIFKLPAAPPATTTTQACTSAGACDWVLTTPGCFYVFNSSTSTMDCLTPTEIYAIIQPFIFDADGDGDYDTVTNDQMLCGNVNGSIVGAHSCGVKVTYTEPAGSLKALCDTGTLTTGACDPTAHPGGFSTIELGHATDTTLGRQAAGIATIEGNVIGGALTPVIDDADNFAANFTGVNLYGGTFIVNAAGTAVLPEPAAGMNFTIVLEGAVATIIDPLGTGTADTIVMNGLAAAADENITSSTLGAMCVFQYRAANSWMATCNGFAEATPP